MKYWWLKNTKGIRYKISSMESVRKFGNWWDSLGLTSDAPVLVHEVRLPKERFLEVTNSEQRY